MGGTKKVSVSKKSVQPSTATEHDVVAVPASFIAVTEYIPQSRHNGSFMINENRFGSSLMKLTRDDSTIGRHSCKYFQKFEITVPVSLELLAITVLKF